MPSNYVAHYLLTASIAILYLIGFIIVKRLKYDTNIYLGLCYATSILLAVFLLTPHVNSFFDRMTKSSTNNEVFEPTFIIAILIVALYFLIILLYSIKGNVEFKNFVSLGYAMLFIVILILFYNPFKNFLVRASKEATNIEIGNTKIELPVVAIHHKKNEIIQDAVDSEKEKLKDATNKIQHLKHVMEYIRFDIDVFKCKVFSAIIQNKPHKNLLKKINTYEEFYSKIDQIILPMVKDRQFNNALGEYQKLDVLWDNDIKTMVSHYYTIFGLMYSGINDFKTCHEFYKEGIKKFPNDFILLHFNAGVSLYEKRDLIDAIHYTRLAMVNLENCIDFFIDEYNNRGQLLNEIILSENDEEALIRIKEAKTIFSGNISSPKKYNRLTEATIIFWKKRLAYWYSLIRLEEDNARRYANEIELYMINNNKQNPSFIDTIGMVKLVYAKDINDIEDAKNEFIRAKKVIDNSKGKYNTDLDDIESRISLVNEILKNT